MPSFDKHTFTSPLSVSPEHHINLVPIRTTSIPELEQESEQELEQEWEKELEQESEEQSEEELEQEVEDESETETKTAESSTSTAKKKNGGEYAAAARLKESLLIRGAGAEMGIFATPINPHHERLQALSDVAVQSVHKEIHGKDFGACIAILTGRHEHKRKGGVRKVGRPPKI
ncbi:hypothetical protein RUND412_009054 [Rhizina undulata]